MRTKYSIKNFLTSFIGNIVSFICLFLGQTVLIKILGIKYAGLNGLFSNVLSLLNLFELGIGSAIVYNLYKEVADNNKENIKSLLQFYKKTYMCIILLIFFVGIIITPFLKYLILEKNLEVNIYIVYLLFLISTISTYVLAYKRSLLFAHQKNYIINIIHMICIILLNCFQILVIYLTKNFYLYLVIKIIFELLENIVISIKTNKDYPYLLEKDIKVINKDLRKEIVKKVKALSIHKVSGFVTNGTDNIFISIFFGLTTVGLYTNYNYIIQTIKTLFKEVTRSTSASVGNLLVKEDYKKCYITFKNINFLNYWITVVTSTCLLFLVEPFIKMWLGDKYLLSNFVLIVLVTNYFQTMMRSTFIIFKDAAGIWIEDKFVPLVQLSLNIGFSLICIKLFGLAGVFIGTIISSFAVWFYSYPKFIYKGLFNKKYSDYVAEVLKHLTLFIVIEIILFIIFKYVVMENIILELLIRLLICFAVTNLILVVIYRNKEEFKYFKKLINKAIR